jgi:hypothetical protein
VYAEVVFGKQVDWGTIKIQPMSNMTASLELFVDPGRKFPHGWLGKNVAMKEVPNLWVVLSNTSSDDEKIGCASIERHLIEACIK